MEIRSVSAASFVLLLLPLSSFLKLSAGAELVSWVCYEGTSYAENSTYQSNVRNLLESLAANASGSQSLFATAVVGTSPDKVWGLGLCRGDFTNGSECASSCLALAPEVAFGNGDYCIGVKDVSIFYDRCIVRYSSYDFLTSPDNRQVQSRGASNIKVAPHADGYDALVASLAVALADCAAFNTTSRYATGVCFTINAHNEVVHTIYGLVQCTPDQAPGLCRECLQGLIDEMKFNGSVARNIMGIWCNLRFEKQPFYDSSPLLNQVAPEPTPPPPSPLLSSTDGTRWRQHARTIISVVGSGLALIIFIVAIIILQKLRTRRRQWMEDEEEDFANLQGAPMRFTFQQLEVATEQFRDKLGEGGFGSVFKGRLGEETIAVKRLDRPGQGKREFLAEVQTIGSIHHINLVRLFGFCAEKSRRLLVYEYMPNGSLDKWIFCRHDDSAPPLKWRVRCKIITSIAKGLSYLHEECMMRIAHLDVKPQNILLDENFNAKLSDFGLCKLIDRDMSQVVTRMRGTPGYLAPEWLKSQITEKVDVYSFGVVVMEIISGRKNLDTSRSEESMHLITILEEKVKSGHLVDLIDKTSNDVQAHEQEVIQMIKLAMWCLQIDCKRRPQMSEVVKVLEGTKNAETNIEHNFVATSLVNSGNAENVSSSAPPLASDLSSPR